MIITIIRSTPSGYLYPIDSYLEFHENYNTTNFMAKKRQLSGE